MDPYPSNLLVAGLIAIGKNLMQRDADGKPIDSIWNKLESRQLFQNYTYWKGLENNNEFTVLSLVGGLTIFSFSEIMKLKNSYENYINKSLLHLDKRFVELLPDIFPEDFEIEFWFLVAEHFGRLYPKTDKYIYKKGNKYYFYAITGKKVKDTREIACNEWKQHSKIDPDSKENIYTLTYNVAKSKWNSLSPNEKLNTLKDIYKYIIENINRLGDIQLNEIFVQNRRAFEKYIQKLGYNLEQLQ